MLQFSQAVAFQFGNTIYVLTMNNAGFVASTPREWRYHSVTVRSEVKDLVRPVNGGIKIVGEGLVALEISLNPDFPTISIKELKEDALDGLSGSPEFQAFLRKKIDETLEYGELAKIHSELSILGKEITNPAIGEGTINVIGLLMDFHRFMAGNVPWTSKRGHHPTQRLFLTSVLQPHIPFFGMWGFLLSSRVHQYLR